MLEVESWDELLSSILWILIVTSDKVRDSDADPSDKVRDSDNDE